MRRQEDEIFRSRRRMRVHDAERSRMLGRQRPRMTSLKVPGPRASIVRGTPWSNPKYQGTLNHHDVQSPPHRSHFDERLAFGLPDRLTNRRLAAIREFQYLYGRQRFETLVKEEAA